MYYDQVNDIYVSQKWVKLLKYSGLYQRPILAACIIDLYYRPVCDIRGRIYNNVAGGIIVQEWVALQSQGS
jgi:hypothetical protein